MSKNNFVKISAILLILSCLFLIFSLFLYGYKTIKTKNSDKGLITHLGRIIEINNEVNNPTLKIDFGQENNPDIQSLSLDYQSKMILPPNPEQLQIDLAKLTIAQQVMAEFYNADKTLKSLIILQPQKDISIIKAKIIQLENEQLDIMTLEESPRSMTFKVSSDIKVIDKTSNQDKDSNIINLKKNDDIYLEYDIDNKISKISLIKIGPK